MKKVNEAKNILLGERAESLVSHGQGFNPNEETKEQKIARLEAAGIIDPNCSGCRYWYEHPTASPFAPSHQASDLCRSGRRPHCTCDTCF